MSLLSKNFFRMVVKKAPLQKSQEVAFEVQSYTVEYVSANRQFFIYDKRDKNATIYDSCNLQCANTFIYKMFP